MIKWLAILLVAWLAYRWWLRPGPAAAPRPDAARPEAMVPCAVCRVYLPQQEAIAEADRFYCCEAHRKHGSP